MRENPWKQCEYNCAKLFTVEKLACGYALKARRATECSAFRETGNYYLYLVWGIHTKVQWNVVYEKIEKDTIINIIMAAIYEKKVYLLQIRTSSDGIRDAFSYAKFEFFAENYRIAQKDNPIQRLQNKLKEDIIEFETPDELNDWYENSVHLCSGEKYTEIFGELFSKVYRNGEWVYEHWQD